MNSLSRVPITEDEENRIKTKACMLQKGAGGRKKGHVCKERRLTKRMNTSDDFSGHPPYYHFSLPIWTPSKKNKDTIHEERSKKRRNNA